MAATNKTGSVTRSSSAIQIEKMISIRAYAKIFGWVHFSVVSFVTIMRHRGARRSTPLRYSGEFADGRSHLCMRRDTFWLLFRQILTLCCTKYIVRILVIFELSVRGPGAGAEVGVGLFNNTEHLALELSVQARISRYMVHSFKDCT